VKTVRDKVVKHSLA